VLAVALAAQALCDSGVTVLRDKLSHGVPPNVTLRLFVWVFAVDAALTPVGVLAGVAGERQPFAVAFVLPLMGLLALFARERRTRIQLRLIEFFVIAGRQYGLAWRATSWIRCGVPVSSKFQNGDSERWRPVS